MDVLSRTIASARAAAPGESVLFDNGDFLQGTPIGAVCASQPPDTPHPWPAILNALSYDAVALGNHDFDFGVPFLERTVAQIDAPVLCASISSGAVQRVVPAVMLHRELACSDDRIRPLSIGVTAVLPPQTAIWNHRYLTGVIEFDAGISAARRGVGMLQAQGADVIVMLCHSGFGTRDADDAENFGTVIAHDIEGIDAIVLGHTHHRFPGPQRPGDLNGVPAVMPGYAAEALGQIDLRLGWADGGWHVAGHSAALSLPAQGQAPVPEITAFAAPALARTRKELNQVLTHSDQGFHTYFGMLGSSTSDALVARAMTDVIAKQVAGTHLATLPLIASVAPMTLGGRAGPGNYVEVPPGPVRARHIAMLAPYSDAIWAAVMTGAELMTWLERAAAFFAPEAEECSRLVNPEAPSFNFDMLHGLEVTIDPFRPARFDLAGRLIDKNAQRVRRLTYHAAPLDDTAPFLVAMTSYRGAGGGNFPGLTSHSEILRTDYDLTEALHETVSGGLPAPGTYRSTWRLASSHTRRVIIETSPNARDHLSEIAAFDPRVIGENPAGFLELSVSV